MATLYAASSFVVTEEHDVQRHLAGIVSLPHGRIQTTALWSSFTMAQAGLRICPVSPGGLVECTFSEGKQTLLGERAS